MATMTARCICSDPGCPAHLGVASCTSGRQATQLLCRTDMTPGVYDMPMCDECASDALASGVFAAHPLFAHAKGELS